MPSFVQCCFCTVNGFVIPDFILFSLVVCFALAAVLKHFKTAVCVGHLISQKVGCHPAACMSKI